MFSHRKEAEYATFLVFPLLVKMNEFIPIPTFEHAKKMIQLDEGQLYSMVDPGIY